MQSEPSPWSVFAGLIFRNTRAAGCVCTFGGVGLLGYTFYLHGWLHHCVPVQKGASNDE